MLTHTFLVDIAHQPSTFKKKFLSQYYKDVLRVYDRYFQKLGGNVNNPYNLPLCNSTDKMYSLIQQVRK